MDDFCPQSRTKNGFTLKLGQLGSLKAVRTDSGIKRSLQSSKWALGLECYMLGVKKRDCQYVKRRFGSAEALGRINRVTGGRKS